METKKSESMKGKNKDMHWYTNDIEEIMSFECPEGFQKGRCKL